MDCSDQPDDFWQQTKTVTDPLHKMIELPSRLFSIIDTPQFQRLRSIKQTGTAHYVYPGAVGARFLHCIGTSFLAQNWITQFRHRQPYLEISDQDVFNITTAGLVHDIGHAPHSHNFERWMHLNGHTEWNHEVMGGKLFEQLIDENGLDWELQDIRRVQGMILGQIVDSERPWMSEVVANHETGVDVDKFDYIPRDSMLLGLPTTFRPARLIENSRVVGGHIAFLHKEALNVYEMFHSRFTLHKLAYQHRICHAIEYMIHDVLNSVDQEYKISEWANDVTRYHLLTDDIFGTIKQDRSLATADARKLLDRIDRHQLYPLVCEFLVDSENIQQLQSLTSAEISNYQSGNTAAEWQLQPHDIIVHKTTINYGKGSSNPVASVRFYSKNASNRSFNVPKSEISAMLPAYFQEYVVRVYLRGDARKLATAVKAVKKLSERQHLKIKL